MNKLRRRRLRLKKGGVDESLMDFLCAITRTAIFQGLKFLPEQLVLEHKKRSSGSVEQPGQEAIAQHLQGSWPHREILGTKIKRIVFARGLVDSKQYTKQRIIEVKASITQFSALDSDLFFIAFQRAASEVILSNGLEAIKSCHSRAAPPPVAVRATPNKVTMPVKQKVPLSKSEVPPSIMAASPFVLRLPTIVSTWTDEYQNSRAHMLLAMPSGTQPGDLLPSIITKVDGVLVLHIKWKWLTIILDPTRMFGHSRFQGHLCVSHPKVVVLVRTKGPCLRLHQILHFVHDNQAYFPGRLPVHTSEYQSPRFDKLDCIPSSGCKNWFH
jgi:hypothetical protein